MESRAGKVLMRWPMPHALAESTYPGTIDEKIGCEVATYAWIENNCPTIPIPHLWGSGFSDSRTYTHVKHRSYYTRITKSGQRCLYAFLRRSVLSWYATHPSQHTFNTGYILLEYVEPSTGIMLSCSWKWYMTDQARRRNLYRGLSRMILTLARLPQPRIGSFRFHDNRTISLTNRPLTCSLANWRTGRFEIYQAGYDIHDGGTVHLCWSITTTALFTNRTP